METGCLGYFMDNFAALKLNYGNEAYSMYFILPDEDVTLSSVMKELNGDKWEAVKRSDNSTSVIIRLPKFKVDYKITLSNNKDYRPLGMEKLLENPDLSEMTSNPILDLQVIQSNTIEVEESGSKAASVTVVNMEPTFVMPENPHIPIDINRPFMFLIEEYSTGAILFAGTIVNL